MRFLLSFLSSTLDAATHTMFTASQSFARDDSHNDKYDSTVDTISIIEPRGQIRVPPLIQAMASLKDRFPNPSLRELGRSVTLAFNRISSRSNDHSRNNSLTDAQLRILHELRELFAIWAAHTNLHDLSERSLDHRLKHSRVIQVLVRGQLKKLVEDLDEVTNVVRGMRMPLDQSADGLEYTELEDGDDETVGQDLRNAQENQAREIDCRLLIVRQSVQGLCDVGRTLGGPKMLNTCTSETEQADSSAA